LRYAKGSRQRLGGFETASNNFLSIFPVEVLGKISQNSISSGIMYLGMRLPQYFFKSTCDIDSELTRTMKAFIRV